MTNLILSHTLAAVSTADWASQAKSPLNGLGHVLLSLMIVVAIILLMAWLFKRARGIMPGADGALKVVDQLSVGRRERVVLVQVGEEQILIGVSPGRIQSLHALDTPVEVTTQSPTRNFSDVLNTLRTRHKPTQKPTDHG